MPKLLLKIGHAYGFSYPRHNFACVPQSLESRRLLVTAIRDTRTDRLDPLTQTLNPHLRRGRWLVTGLDLDKGEERSFYLDSMVDVCRIAADQPMFAVVDRSALHYRTNDPLASQMFACGRGGDAIVVRLMSPKLSPASATSRQGQRRAVSNGVGQNTHWKRKGNQRDRK